MNSTNDQTLFEEQQFFRQTWLWSLLSIIIVLFISLSLIPNHSSNNNDQSLLIYILLILFIGILILFYKTNLQVRISSSGINYRWVPFNKNFKIVSFSEIDQIQFKTYKAIREFGGWGYRIGIKATANTVSGNKGIYIQFKSKKKRALLLGSNKTEELRNVLNDLANKNIVNYSEHD
ncbi:MAG TPA: hypothetical protein PKM16_09940 [Bacteroidia bacterium]|nr:hypothetical protein [Bacteroidia bacterium]